MYLRTLLIALVLGAVAIFTMVNWQAFATPTSLSLLVGTVEAPLGLLLLGVLAVLTALFLIYVAYLQSSVLLETRRHTRALEAQRELAERAEASRLQDLRDTLERKLDALAHQHERAEAERLERLDGLQRDLRRSIEQCQNSLTASIAELDDRLDRGHRGQQTQRELPSASERVS